MYEKFYGFSERPFSLLPDPDFLFLGEKHRAALDTLELAIFNQSGFCVVSGEIGAGKTTLIRELLNRLDNDIQVGLVSNTHPSFGELMQWVMTAYGLPGDTDDRLELHRRFVDFVIQCYAEGKRTLLIIDEAQNLSMDALEELRMLSNINSEKDLVLQIIMIGQSELRDKLRKPELAQFAQRISVDYFLSGLNSDETCHYIQHRVVHAGGAADLFMVEACQHIYAFSQGIPRVINRLCDLSLVYGYAKQYEQIDAGLVEAVAREQHLGEAMETARQRAAVATENNVALKTEDDRPELRQPSEPESVVEPESAVEIEPVTEPEPVSEIESVAEPEPVIKPEIVAETESVIEPELMPDNHEPPPELSVKPSADDSVAKTSGKAVSSDLHALVVNAEQSRNTRSERSALWLFVVVAVMVGAAAWMSRNEWMPAAGTLATLGEQKKETSAQADETRRLQDEARLAEQRAVAEKAKREEAARLAEQRAAEKAKQAQVKREKAQREKAARLAKQRAAEKAKQAQVKREKAQREKAARLAKQRAAEKTKQAQVKREKAQREKAARLAKQRAAEKTKQAQVRREQAEAKPAIVPATVSRPSARNKDSVFPAAWANTPEWSEEDDDELLIEEPVVEAAVSPPAEATTATASVSEEENPDSVVEPGGFASNPCNGPTARFLSTCR